MPRIAANSAALAGVRVAPATNRMSSLLPWTLSTRFRPQVPRPMMAARIIDAILANPAGSPPSRRLAPVLLWVSPSPVGEDQMGASDFPLLAALLAPVSVADFIHG